MTRIIESTVPLAASAVTLPPRRELAPAAAQFARHVRSRRRAAHSRLHGFAHWKGVAWLGSLLASATPGADPLVAVLFGLFHDIERHNDGDDPQHGARAADVVASIGADALGIHIDQLELLKLACRYHSDGTQHQEPTIACCWDADRLTLWRCNIIPHRRFMSTELGRSTRLAELGKAVARVPPSWTDVFHPSGYPNGAAKAQLNMA